MLDTLPFREIWGCDFEFIADPGERPVPVCVVAQEFRSGRVIRLWQDEFTARPPFPVDDQSLFVSFGAAAELKCFGVLGWPMPARVIDLYAEYRALTSGIRQADGYTLLAALSRYGLPAITAEQKTAGRALVMKGGPWSAEERRDILAYCRTDVTPLGPLLERMLPSIRLGRQGLGQALLRGRYTAAQARIELQGVPIDVSTLTGLRANWEALKLALIAEVDRDYGVYDGTTFKTNKFAALLHSRGLDWPVTATGRLSLEDDVFKEMCGPFPWLNDLRELRNTLGKMRLAGLLVGVDGRNRVFLAPFGAKSGRNAPSTTEFIFGPAVWMRGLIKPEPGRAVAYIDWRSQEFAIAAVLSGDRAMIEAVRSGDPYLTFAKMAGLAPADATKTTHKEIRDQCKTAVLGTNYGQQARGLAMKINRPVREADRLLKGLANTFDTYWRWADHQVEVGTLRRRLQTVFGWPIHVDHTTAPNTLRNFPMQANGAEMLRLACCLATERGIEVCAPIHDAVLVEGPADSIDSVVEATEAAMREASRTVLDGFEIGTDAEVVRWPDRYEDARGTRMWARVMGLMDARSENGGGGA